MLRGDPAFDVDAFRVSMTRYVRRFGCGPESLSWRGHDLSAFLHFDFPRMRLSGLTPGKPAAGAGMAEGMAVFTEIAKAEVFYLEGEAPPASRRLISPRTHPRDYLVSFISKERGKMGAYPEVVPAAYLGGFRVLRPEYSASNEEGVDWLSRAHARAEAVLRGDPAFDEDAFRVSMARYARRFGCGPESLSRRGHDLPDFLHLDFPRMRLFGLAQGRPAAGAGMPERMEVFAEIAKAKAEAFYPEGEAPPRDILHVTCTGYVAPGAVQEMVAARGWQDRTGVTHVYHMGCYAAMPAARIAAGYLASKGLGMPAGAGGEADDRVDIVHTEACTLHLDPTRHDPEQLVVQSLFADGHIRYSLRSRRGEGPALALLGVREALVPGSLGAMGWLLGDRGMRMSLSREVPELISGALKGFLRGLFAACGVDAAEAFGKGVFAVHPGGPRIIDKVAELLELSPGQVAASRAVLRDFGNMSSATLPHIWERMAADSDLPAGTPVTSLAFGPGLTVYGAMLRKA